MKRTLSSLFIAEALSRALSFFIIIYVSRVLGATELGYWSYALAINAFLIIATNLGLDVYAMVEATKDLRKRSSLYINTITIKALLAFGALGVLWSLHSYMELKVLLLITMLLCADLLSAITPVWYYQAAEKFRTISHIKITQAVSYFFLVLLLLWWFENIVTLAVAYIGANLLSAVIFGKNIFKELSFSSIKPHHWRKIIKVSIYLGGALFLNQIYTNTDKIMIAHMLGIKYNGYYEAGYKLYALVPVIFSTVWTVYAPKVTKSIDAMRSYKWSIVILSFFIAAVFYFGKDFIITLLYSEKFAPTISLMPLFALSIIVLAWSYVYTSLLTILEKSKEWFWIAFASATLNILLNFFLIPYFRLQGALYATIIAESVAAIGGYYVYKKVKEASSTPSHTTR
ncbi:hypothetical protein NitYY0826_C0924 [Nitratiruptor sp. YY08-26]|uniref:flippase n=1 Tax=unclassified Nitratiruptor TaxID=2624044 RepID=UPI001916C11E|nr:MULTISPECIES: flippase [unclassified Nitratiruptor]BCD62055.1 hypothetical protein NitYY0813_C0922 [Nitratiruptor sp. YY08-13]BCD65991.1 hypothetical protein NitYY0826_C0924 [Nitratiruptor sp. YY08-26]